MRYFYIFLASLFLLILVLFIGEANESPSLDQVYIVYMGGNAGSRSLHHQLMTDLSIWKKNSVVHIYNRSFFGFAAHLSEKEAKWIERTSGVVSVHLDRSIKLHTTHSWDFLMSQMADFPMNINNKSIHASSSSTSPCESGWPCRGHDTIIGILDSGIWPEHLSFNDKCMDPIPSARWKGTCMADVNSTPFPCNKKLIGARYYDNLENPGYITTALDKIGHGTYVSSIAAGVPVPGAALRDDLAKGTARGGSSCSRIAMYRVCGADLACPYSGVIKAFDDAIADGVDLISISLGWEYEGFFDGVSIGAFHASEKGILVVASAGNSGPSPGTVENAGPWIMTVGASTIDRDFQSTVVLGNNKNIRAGGIISPSLSNSAVYGLVDGYSARSHPDDATNSTNCVPGSLDGSKVKDKIVLCEDTDPFTYEEKIDSLTKQGAIGIILISNYMSSIAFDFGTTAFAPITKEDGAQIRSYINTTRHPLATILPTRAIMNYKPAPVVASFSSRGPIDGVTALLKPDVLAPGVNILGAKWSPNGDQSRIDAFSVESGTSASCPHVSGLAAVVKSWHPAWSASAIRSAIMTTAIHTNNLKTQITTMNGSTATAYDMGAGEISLLGPLSPGLVYETETIDYLQFLCNMGYNTSVIETISSTLPLNFDCPDNSSPDMISDMNYPSIAVYGLQKNNAKTVKRIVTNVGEQYSTYTATVDAPAGLQVQVVPNKLQFTKDIKKQSFEVRFTLTTTPKENMFGSIIWSNCKHKVRSQFVASNTA